MSDDLSEALRNKLPDVALPAVSSRTCGDCAACCLVLGVRPLDKAPFTRCKHQCDKGCGTYETRPDPCKNYRCAWLDGLGQRRDRPDRLGVIFDTMAPSDEVEAAAAGGDTAAIARVEAAHRTVRAREVHPGAFGRDRAKRWAVAMHAAGKRVILVPFGGRKLPTGRPIL